MELSFKVDFAHQVNSSKFPHHPGCILALLSYLERLGGGHVVCDSEYVAFEGWEDELEGFKGVETAPQSQRELAAPKIPRRGLFEVRTRRRRMRW